MRNIILYLMIFYTVSVCTVHAGLTVRPNNAEVVVGQKVRLRCSTSDIYSVNWEHVPTGSRSKKYVFFGGGMIIPYHRRFSVDRGIGNSQYDLVISSVEKSDSGRFRCTDREGQGEQSEAELVVLESPPECHSDEFIGENSCGVEKQEELRIYCSVLYSGNVVPSVKCSNFNDSLVQSDVVLNPGNVSYIFILKPNLQIIGTSHTCYTTVSNVTSDAFNFSVTYVADSQKQVKINHRTRLTCSANSTETCNYRWITADGNITSLNKTTEIELPGMYRCEADCLINGQTCTVRCLEVTYEAAGGSSTLIAIIVALVVLAVLLIAIPLVVIKGRNRRMTETWKRRQLCEICDRHRFFLIFDKS